MAALSEIIVEVTKCDEVGYEARAPRAQPLYTERGKVFKISSQGICLQDPYGLLEGLFNRVVVHLIP